MRRELILAPSVGQTGGGDHTGEGEQCGGGRGGAAGPGDDLHLQHQPGGRAQQEGGSGDGGVVLQGQGWTRGDKEV